MPDPRLILPYDVEGVLVDVVDRRHAEHLAAAERRRGDPPRTYQPLATVVRMSDAAAVRLSGDTLPALLVGVIGAPDFQRNEVDGIDAVFQVGMQVTVMGKRRRDVLLRRDVTAWTIVECIYARVPRRGIVNSVRLVDYEPLSEGDEQRTIGDARLIWEVGVANAVSITGGLPADDLDWPPEGGGPPTDPYDPIDPRPDARPTFEIDRVPIAE
jgi:hypothetical protein